MSRVNEMYEGYWKSKKGLERFEDYERNIVLRNLFKAGEKVLDLASGEGAVSEFIQSLGCEVTAFDISEVALKKAAQRGIKVLQGDVEKRLPFKEKQFDVVFWGDNAEHLFLPGKTLGEIRRVLKNSGRIIISCPNMGYWRYRFDYLYHGMVPKTEWHSQVPWQWEHIRFFNYQVMKDFLKMSNFKINTFHGVSKRRIDKLLLPLSNKIFGMIMVVEAKKK